MDEQQIFLRAVEIEDTSVRSSYLEEACAGDILLRQQIERLLQVHDGRGEFLEIPVFDKSPSTMLRIHLQDFFPPTP
jgi:hypothetical protein